MAMPTKGPNYFIIGAPKCGTTALSVYLRGHPNVFVTEPKETNFFNRDFDYYDYGDPDSLPGYLRFYDDAGPEHTARGEASVWYLLSRVAAQRIHAVAPEARLIAMVRNPVDLVHSLHAQLLYTYDEDEPDFETAWRLQPERRAGRHIPKNCRQPAFLQYAEVATVSTQLQRFIDVFSREQLLVIVFDDFKRDPRAAYQRVLEHLGVPPDDRQDFEPVNESKVHRMRWLSRFTERPPRPLLKVAMELKQLLGIESLRVLPKIREVNLEKRRRVPLRPEMVAELQGFYATEVDALGRLIGRDLSAWSSRRAVDEQATGAAG